MKEGFSEYPRGSEWSIWDLHIHTPCSIQQLYGGNTPEVWEKYLRALEALPEEVKILGITDYYFPDGYERVMEARENGRLPKIQTVLPILEFRIDTFGSASESNISKVNLHIAFDIDARNWRKGIERVRSDFIECLAISKHLPNKRLLLKNFQECASDHKLKTGFSELYPHTEEVLRRLEPWKDETLLFLGYNEWNQLDRGKQAKLEKQVLFDRVHGILTASRTDLLEKKKQTIASFGDKALLHSLDIHDFAKFDKYECSTWIKAEPTFEGLRQALALPEERLSHDLRPAKLLSVTERPASVIESVEIRTTSDDGEWFDQVGQIPLNPGLVAIIGNKGMGKTALADAICAAANCSNAQYSFLSKERFFKHRASKKYTAELTFADRTRSASPFKNLRHTPSRPSRVVYLSQTFVENLCNDAEGAGRLQTEIDRVIFSQIPLETRGSYTDLDSLVRATAEFHSRRVEEIRLEIREINQSIAAAEGALTAENRSRLQLAVDELNQKLEEHKSKPPDPPTGGPAVKGALHRLVEKRGEREQKAARRRQELEGELARLGERRQKLARINEDIETLQTSWKAIERFIKGDEYLNANLSMDMIAPLTVNLKPLLDLQSKLSTEIESKRAASNTQSELIECLRKSVTRIQAKLQGRERMEAAAIVARQNWQRVLDALVGSPELQGSLEHARAQLLRLDNHYPTLLTRLTAKRRELCTELWQKIGEKERALAALYGPAQERAGKLAAQFAIPSEEFLAFDSTVRLANSFSNDFLAMINKSRGGRFYGSDKAQRQVDLAIQQVTEEKEGSWLELPFHLEALIKEGNSAADQRADWTEQLAGGRASVAEFYNFLFSMQYLQGRFSLTFGNKPIDLLSPGDRGLLLLSFFLLVDTSDKPIVIDQPEENVDNETVYLRLVQFIKAAKRERQIIIVTHNPNLAVVCDAEQIICASRDKQNRDLVTYRSGGLESELKDDVLRVLEGTRPAFVTRKHKYRL